MEPARRYLESVVFDDDRKPVFNVFTEEALIGLRLENSLWDTDISGDRPVDLGERGEARFADLFVPHLMEFSGTHRLEGVAILSGPSFRRGGSIEGATVFDVAPTILALAGLPVAEDMKGSALEGALEPSFLEIHPIRTCATYESGRPPAAVGLDSNAAEKIKSRLRSLGYL
jgi:hypothetical protein